MIGAILGDIAGSIHENIPKLKRTRLVPCVTDDTLLTCACNEWVNSLNTDEVGMFLGLQDVRNDLFESAVFFLKKWGKEYPESGFSKGFLSWVHSNPFEQTNKNTNGCLMRQSPIAQFCVKHGFSLSIAIELATIFASVSHNDENALLAVKKHIRWIYLLLKKELSLKELKEELATTCNIQEINHWFKSNQEKFIWDAKTSLDIAASCIYFSNSYEETIQNCINCSGDTDTYAAIAGPIAQALWGIKSKTVLDLIKYIQFPAVSNMWSAEIFKITQTNN